MVQDGLLKAEINKYQYKFLKTEVEEYRNKNNIVSTLSTFDSAWAWRKND